MLALRGLSGRTSIHARVEAKLDLPQELGHRPSGNVSGASE